MFGFYVNNLHARQVLSLGSSITCRYFFAIFGVRVSAFQKLVQLDLRIYCSTLFAEQTWGGVRLGSGASAGVINDLIIAHNITPY